MDTLYFKAIAAPTRDDVLVLATQFYVQLHRWLRSFNRRIATLFQRGLFRSYLRMWRTLRQMMRGG